MQIRNVGLVSHQGAGKTSLAESMLFETGTTDRLGSVDNGSTVSDFDPVEVERKMSISLSLLPQRWKETKLNIIDTPGYVDFIGEVKSSLRVIEGAVVVVCAASGVEVGTERVWADVEEAGLPRMVFVNKMDRDNADFYSTLETIQSTLSTRCLPLLLPVGSQADFAGVVDLVEMKAYLGPDMTEAAIPGDLQERCEAAREQLIEAAVEVDDDLISKYLDGGEITNDELRGAIRRSTIAGQLMPVLVGSALRRVGIRQLLDAICSWLPSPDEGGALLAQDATTGEPVTLKPDPGSPFSALVFKTTADPYVGKISCFRVYSGAVSSNSQVWNSSKKSLERFGQLFTLLGKTQQSVSELGAGDIGAVARLESTATGDTVCTRDGPVVLDGIEFPRPNFGLSIQPNTKADLDKMSTVLPRVCEEDPSIQVRREPDTNEFIVSGMGDSHLDILKERMRRKFGVEVRLAAPKIPYKETVAVKTKAEHKHKKQSGGHGQYGHVIMEVEPLPRAGGFEFGEKIFGGAIPRNYIPSVEKGVVEAKQEGVVAGYPVIDIRVTLVDGSFHAVDSSDIAFKIAASQALKKGLTQGQPLLLEPIMDVTITVPDSYTGDITSDLSTKRGRVLGMVPEGGSNVIQAQVPYAEVLGYAIDLRSITQGRGTFTMEFSHYEEVPAHVTQKIVNEGKKEDKE